MYEVLCDGAVVDLMGNGRPVPSEQDARARVAFHAGMSLAERMPNIACDSPEYKAVADEERRRGNDPTYWNFTTEKDGSLTIMLHGHRYVIRRV